MQEVHLAADDLIRVLLRLAPARRVSILDSGGARGADARFLIAGFDPFEIVEARGEWLRISRRGENTERVMRGDVLRVLDEQLETYSVPRDLLHAHLPATGACIATFSYDLVRRFERLPRAASTSHETTEPDVVLAFYDTLVIHDYARGVTEIVSVSGADRLKDFYDAINDAAQKLEAQSLSETENSWQTSIDHVSASSGAPDITPANIARSNFTRDEYIAAILRIKEHIAAGDIYQANLTQQLVCALNDKRAPEQIFARLRRDHPASFAAFLRRREDVVISASPERFLRVEMSDNGRSVEAWPIKGTRPRGVDAEEDARLRAELQRSEKDRAENVMIVDLLRNDLGRVCRYGSIHVPELFTVQEHPTLFHLVSKVRGLLRPGVTVGDLLRATFPCGSVTGAPKIRAMEIIDEIETVPRGLSMGAIGYFSFHGALDLNVAIRTMTVREETARFNVGGGIVADSDPALEYEESLVKARALLRALNTGL